MQWQTLGQLINGHLNEVDGEMKQRLRDCVLTVKEFQNLRHQMGGDDTAFDECFKFLKYEFIPKNQFVMYPGQKRDFFYFILEGICGIFSSKSEAQISMEISIANKIVEETSELKKIQNKLSENQHLQGEEEHQLNMKMNVIQENILKLEANISQYKKENDQIRIKEALSAITEKKLRNSLNFKYFISSNQICSIQRGKVIISGDTVDEINIGCRESKSIILTLEDTHFLKINISDYSKVFSHVMSFVQQCQKILRFYFQDAIEETVQQLSYQFKQVEYQRNEVIYHQNSRNPNLFYILLAGVIEIRKYYGKSNPQQQQNLTNNNSFLGKDSSSKVDNLNHLNRFQSQNIKSRGGVIEGTKNGDKFGVKVINTHKEMNSSYDKTFSVSDNYYSIMTFSEKQVFGIECYESVNQYSAVSISTETKVFVMDKSKFNAFDHQFNFKEFLIMQGMVQSQFFMKRLSQLNKFQQKQIVEKQQNTKIVSQPLLKQCISSKSTSPLQNQGNNNKGNKMDTSPSIPYQLKNNQDFQQYLHKKKENKLHENCPIHYEAILLNKERECNSLERMSKVELEKQKLNQKNYHNQGKREYSEKAKQENNINNISKSDDEAHHFLKEMELPMLQKKIKQNGADSFNKTSLDFELDSDKIRRNNILLEHKVSKYMKITKLQPVNKQKEDQFLKTSNSEYNQLKLPAREHKLLKQLNVLHLFSRQGEEQIQMQQQFSKISEKFDSKINKKKSVNKLNLAQPQKYLDTDDPQKLLEVYASQEYADTQGSLKQFDSQKQLNQQMSFEDFQPRSKNTLHQPSLKILDLQTSQPKLKQKLISGETKELNKEESLQFDSNRSIPNPKSLQEEQLQLLLEDDCLLQQNSSNQNEGAMKNYLKISQKQILQQPNIIEYPSIQLQKKSQNTLVSKQQNKLLSLKMDEEEAYKPSINGLSPIKKTDQAKYYSSTQYIPTKQFKALTDRAQLFNRSPQNFIKTQKQRRKSNSSQDRTPSPLKSKLNFYILARSRQVSRQSPTRKDKNQSEEGTYDKNKQKDLLDQNQSQNDLLKKNVTFQQKISNGNEEGFYVTKSIIQTKQKLGVFKWPLYPHQQLLNQRNSSLPTDSQVSESQYEDPVVAQSRFEYSNFDEPKENRKAEKNFLKSLEEQKKFNISMNSTAKASPSQKFGTTRSIMVIQKDTEINPQQKNQINFSPSDSTPFRMIKSPIEYVLE